LTFGTSPGELLRGAGSVHNGIAIKKKKKEVFDNEGEDMS